MRVAILSHDGTWAELSYGRSRLQARAVLDGYRGWLVRQSSRW
jgi:hypothetical protein